MNKNTLNSVYQVAVIIFTVIMSFFILDVILKNHLPKNDEFPLNKTVEQVIGEKDAKVNVTYRVTFSEEKNKYQYTYRLAYNGEKPIFLRWEILDHLFKNDVQIPVIFVISNKNEQVINFYHDKPPVLTKGFAVIDKKITIESENIELDLNDIWVSDTSTNLAGPIPHE